MDATLTIRIKNLPTIDGTLVKNIFTHFLKDDSGISYQKLNELQESKEPLNVLIITEEDGQNEFKAYITHLNIKSVQFLLFSG